jgi:hypothetical protein
VVYDDNSHGLTPELRLQAFEGLFTDVLQPGGYYFWRNDRTFPASTNIFVRSLYQLYCEAWKDEVVVGRERIVRFFEPSAIHRSLCSNYAIEQGVWQVGCNTQWCFVKKRPRRVCHVREACKSRKQIKRKYRVVKNN